ncbi:BTB/POZ domain-containing protein POB1-like [Lolium rigidum]|uniref:BTB/POZ domain-containing protein POB1-like n=1 Tax=Lolium rigidum TaxID=89674 RepID=UPI001F5DD8D6|nr:BTB/POZ domain-containing protein POB1-like [Lolium rigidum]
MAPPNYEFAFNSKAYSDRTLVLEIVAVGGSSRSGSGDGSVHERSDSTAVHPRCLDVDANKSSPGSGIHSSPESNHPKKRPRPDDEAVEATPKGDYPQKRPRADDEAAGKNGEEDEEEKENGEDEEEVQGEGTPVLRVEQMRVSSVILAGESPFFQTLFDNNSFKESGAAEVKLRLTTEEVDALRELVFFMYCRRLNTTDPVKIIAVLGAADKFQAGAAAQHCIALLQQTPMTTEIALMYLEHPVSTDLLNLFKPVKSYASSYFAKKFRNVFKSNDELMTMPLSAITAVFSSSNIVLPSEDHVIKFFSKWVEVHYADLIQRKSVFNSDLVPLVRFVHLSCRQLKDLLAHDLLDMKTFSSSIVCALLFKVDASFSQLPELRVPGWNYAPRYYKLKALKVTHFQKPVYQSVCYMDLKREECLILFPEHQFISEPFTIATNQMILKARCSQQEGTGHVFGLCVGIGNFTQPVTCRVEISVRRPHGLFQTDFRSVSTFNSSDQLIGSTSLIPWAQLTAENSPWWINGTLHLRVEVTLMQPQQQQFHQQAHQQQLHQQLQQPPQQLHQLPHQLQQQIV